MAREMRDIGLTGGQVLTIAGGDFVIVESTGEHQRQLLVNNKNDFKQNPTICVGLLGYVDDEGPDNIMRATTQQFMGVGMEVVNLVPSGSDVMGVDKIFVNAFYK